MPSLRLLGGAVLEDDDGPVAGPAARPQPLALLALLTTAPSHERSRGKLVGILWREASERQARGRLNSCVHRIRSGLGESAVLSVGDALRLNREVLSCDVPEFEEALEEEDWRRAVELYEGPFLDGFRLKGAPAFEKWVDRERERLTRGYREALEALAERAEERGEPETASRWWRERVREDPFDSRVVRRLMRSLAGSGNRAEALRVARTHERLIEEELGGRPDEEVRALAERIEEGAGEDRPAPSGGTAAVEDAPRSGSRDADRGDEEVTGPVSGGEGTALSPGSDEGGPGHDRTVHARSAGSRSLRRRAGQAVLALLLLGGAFAAWRLAAERRDPSSAADPRTVAVLPFRPIGTGDPGPIAEGLHNDLLTRLSQVSGLAVTSATSVQRFRDTDLPLPAVAESLGVTWILEGAVQRADSAIRVNAQLVDPRTDTHAWARTYRRDLTAENLFELQGDLARRIARSLRAKLSAREERRLELAPTADLEAYRLYARGRALLLQRTESSMRRAETLFRRAVEQDSTFAPAWALLAHALVLYPRARGRDPDSVFPLGRDAARRALELDPELAEAHGALSVVDFYRMRLPSSLRRMERAIRLEPSFAMGYHGLNLIHLVLGRPEEALEHARRAVALNPMSPENQVGMALAALAVGDPGRALEAARRVREIEPEYAVGLPEGYARYRLGELPDRDTVADGAMRGPFLALSEARAGDSARVRRILSELAGRDPPSPRWLGLLQAAAGRRTEALETFRTAIRQRETSAGGLTITLRHYYPDILGPLRRDPRWDALVREINVAWGLDPDGSVPDGEGRELVPDAGPGE